MTQQEFEHIAQQLRPLLLHIGQQFFGNSDNAEDIAQETLMRLWQLRDRIEQKVELEPLAIRMAKNLCISEWRRRQVRNSVSLSKQEAITNETISRQLEANEAIAQLRSALTRLKPTEQRLFRMRHELEMDITEISAVTGIAPRSVSAMLSTAKRKLSEILNSKGGQL
jgi:RNA polymerase sigma factor (sigma-70 family)